MSNLIKTSNEYYIFDDSMTNSNACKLYTEDYIQKNYSTTKSLQKFNEIQDCVDTFNKSAILYVNYMKDTVIQNNRSNSVCLPIATPMPATEIKDENIFSSLKECTNSITNSKDKK